MEFEDMEPMFNEDDLEDFERNQLAHDRALEFDDEAPPEQEIEDYGDLID